MQKNPVRHRVEEEVFPSRPSALVRGFATKNYSFPMHDHSFYEINIIMEGRGKHYLASGCVDALPGDVFVIPPSVPHGYESGEENFNVYHLILKDAFFACYGEQIRLLRGYSHLFAIEPYLRAREHQLFLKLEFEELLAFSKQVEIFSQLEADTSLEADTFRSIRALSVIAGLCHSMTMSMQRSDSGLLADYAAMSESLHYMHSNLSEKLRIDELAAMAGMSRATYIRKFRKLFDKPPMAYILQCRIREAEKRIAYGQAKTQVAQECGFYDVSHMERALAKRKE